MIQLMLGCIETLVMVSNHTVKTLLEKLFINEGDIDDISKTTCFNGVSLEFISSSTTHNPMTFLRTILAFI